MKVLCLICQTYVNGFEVMISYFIGSDKGFQKSHSDTVTHFICDFKFSELPWKVLLLSKSGEILLTFDLSDNFLLVACFNMINFALCKILPNE